MVSIREAKKTIEEILFGFDDVVAVGIPVGTETIAVYLRSENPETIAKIPTNVAGYPVVITVIGGIVPLTFDRKALTRPLVGGTSVAHRDVTAGTLTTIVRDKNTKQPCILSNNHVLANFSTVTSGATVGDPVHQPGPYDYPASPTTLAGHLLRWIPLEVGPYNLNVTDAAIATTSLDVQEGVMTDEGTFIPVTETISPSVGMQIKKYGRTTSYQVGEIVDVDAAVQVQNNRTGEFHWYRDQIIANLYVRGGDSGSLVLDMNNRAVGIIWGGSQDGLISVASKINTTLAVLDVELGQITPPPNGGNGESKYSATDIIMMVAMMSCVGIVATSAVVDSKKLMISR
jgi:hypothetical protein